jgi:hypothetical protein
MELSGYAFGRVCDVEPDRTDGGAIEVHVPQPDYDRRDEKSVHDYGWGPFCSFGVPDDGTHCPGVYAITVADEVVYVGETKDLYEQFANGYGRISPANCFEGGQQTNCRLNTAIFHAARAGERVSLHLHATDDFGGTGEENRALRRIIKDDLVTALDPAWNKGSGASESAASETERPAAEADAPDGRTEHPTTEAGTRPAETETRTTGAEHPTTDADPSTPRPTVDGTESEFVSAAPEAERTDSARPTADRPETSDSAAASERAETSEPPMPLERSDSTERGTADRAERSERPADPPAGDDEADEFAELRAYLADHEHDRIERTFADLEVVLDGHLPTEARRWQRWWTNDESSHPHSRAWLRAGYEVAEVSLPEGRVVFERRERDGTDSPSDERPPVGRVSPRRRE